MNFTLLYPAALAALAALVIPILLHLIRRADYTLTPFAAMRWIAAQLRQQRRLRLRDLPLLLLRLLLLALVAILLAQPVLRGDVTAAAHWVLVAPGADVGEARKQINASNADWRWLAADFPALATHAEPPTSASASLLREIDAELPASSRISVVVPAIVDGLDGERPLLSRDVEWIVVGDAMPAIVHAGTTPPREVQVRGVDATTAPFVTALTAAWKQAGMPNIVVDSSSMDSAIAADTRWLLWLSETRPQALLDWIDRGGVAIAASTPAAIAASTDAVLWRSTDQTVIATIRSVGKGRLIQLRGTLSPAQLPVLLDGDFPTRLQALFAGEPASPTRAYADALQPRKKDAASSVTSVTPATRSPLDAWFAVLIAALFAIERFLASSRGRTAS